LLTQYIGSILIALLACEGFLLFISQTVREIALYFSPQRTAAFQSDIAWNRWISTLVTTGVYFCVAFLLARWLYPAFSTDLGVGGPEAESDAQPQIEKGII
jgi:hypothetical protein